MLLLIYFAVAFAASLVLTPLCRALAHRYGFVATRPHESTPVWSAWAPT